MGNIYLYLSSKPLETGDFEGSIKIDEVKNTD